MAGYDRSMYDAVWLNGSIASMTTESPYGAIRDGAIAVKAGRIAWVGARADYRGSAEIEHDLRGAWVTPGLIDCHTHLVYAGNRASEFELRLNGASYEDIARAGGGIISTVRSTRQAAQEELHASAQKRLRQWKR